MPRAAGPEHYSGTRASGSYRRKPFRCETRASSRQVQNSARLRNCQRSEAASQSDGSLCSRTRGHRLVSVSGRVSGGRRRGGRRQGCSEPQLSEKVPTCIRPVRDHGDAAIGRQRKKATISLTLLNRVVDRDGIVGPLRTHAPVLLSSTLREELTSLSS